jgi:hypothetical protein
MDKSRLKAVITLMALAAVIIIVMAILVAFNFAHLELGYGIILAIIGVIGLFIIGVVLLLFSRSVSSGKKTTSTKK